MRRIIYKIHLSEKKFLKIRVNFQEFFKNVDLETKIVLDKVLFLYRSVYSQILTTLNV